MILTPGGKLAFVGTPAEALNYFSIDRLGDVYELLKSPKPTPEQLKQDPQAEKNLADGSAKQWQMKFRSSPYWQRYVVERLPPAAAYTPPTSKPTDPLSCLVSSAAAATRPVQWRCSYWSC